MITTMVKEIDPQNIASLLDTINQFIAHTSLINGAVFISFFVGLLILELIISIIFMGLFRVLSPLTDSVIRWVVLLIPAVVVVVPALFLGVVFYKYDRSLLVCEDLEKNRHPSVFRFVTDDRLLQAVQTLETKVQTLLIAALKEEGIKPSNEPYQAQMIRRACFIRETLIKQKALHEIDEQRRQFISDWEYTQ